MSDAIRLNIGAGESNLPGFIPIDAKLGHDASKLSYPDASVDEVYSSHCLEHIHHSKTAETVKEWCRVLKPGGRIRIAIPDFSKVLALHRSDPDRYSSSFLSAWHHGTHDEDTDRHQAIILRADLEAMLRASGVEEIGWWDGEYDDQAKHNAMTLNIGGYKRETRITRHPKVVMMLSMPRFGPLDMQTCVAEVCREMGWVYRPWGGTEWGKGMECGVQDIIARENPDYICTLDYDSVFEADDLKKMVDFMQRHPEVAAAWPAQVHRHMDLPLGMAPAGAAMGAYDYSGEFTKMWSGHFGCTIIRRQVFDSLPHPWFWSIPDPNTGDWANSSDADITFWRLCDLHGFLIGQINTVQIGHMELCVKWMTPKGIIWQPIQNYRKNGRPTQAAFDGQFWVDRCKKQYGTTQDTPAAAGVPVPSGPETNLSSKEIEPSGVIAPRRTQEQIEQTLGFAHRPPASPPKPMVTFPESTVFKPVLNGAKS